MRLACAVFTFAAITVTVATVRADEFPYQGYVSGDDVYVRSGAGRNYYPTDKLPRGVLLEIWRHDPGGWYAVRPPEGSFSWVAARHLKLVDDNIAEVTGDRVTAYVGSRFSDVHDVRQVQLDRGELVEIVGEKRFTAPGAGATETWYKVAPPSGEFRWVFGRYVTRRGIPDTTAERATPGEAKPLRRPAWTNISEHGDHRHHDHDRYSEDHGRYGDDGGEYGESIRAASYDGSHGHRHESRSGESLLACEAPPRPLHVAASELQQLDLELSTMIAEPPLDWQLDDLRGRAERELEKADSALARGRARRLLNEIDRCQQLQEEYQQFAQVDRHTGRRGRLAEDAAKPIGGTDGSDIAADHATDHFADQYDASDFDGVGRLTPVKSRRYGAPRYALIDRDGNLLMFVSEAPGLDMQRYIGQKVGVAGTRGFIAQLRKPHVTATHVEPLDASVLVARKQAER